MVNRIDWIQTAEATTLPLYWATTTAHVVNFVDVNFFVIRTIKSSFNALRYFCVKFGLG